MRLFFVGLKCGFVRIQLIEDAFTGRVCYAMARVNQGARFFSAYASGRRGDQVIERLFAAGSHCEAHD
jgi:hypothetical protein